MSIKIRHLGWHRSPEGFHDGVITVATKKDEKTGAVAMGFSFCSPSDGFCRKRGRLDAIDRLETEPLLDLSNERDSILYTICEIDRIKGNIYGFQPHRAHGRALTWLPNWLLENCPAYYFRFKEISQAKV